MATNNQFPFSPVEVRTQGTAGVDFAVGAGALDAQLGMLVEVYTTVDGYYTQQLYQLVEADLASGNFDARGKAFKWGTRATYRVVPGNANTDKVAGIGPYRDPLMPQLGTAGAVGISSLDDEDYFWLCVEGDRVEVIHGDYFATDPLDGTKFFMVIDDDADLGKIAGTATFTSGSTVARYVSGTAADNAVMVVALRAHSAV